METKVKASLITKDPLSVGNGLFFGNGAEVNLEIGSSHFIVTKDEFPDFKTEFKKSEYDLDIDKNGRLVLQPKEIVPENLVEAANKKTSEQKKLEAQEFYDKHIRYAEVAITGRCEYFQKRTDLKKVLAISKDVGASNYFDVLIKCGSGTTSQKYRKATRNGITIISELDVYTMWQIGWKV